MIEITVVILLLKFTDKFISMRSIQRRNIQVKCNFCMQWMILNTDVKLNINVCDVCIDQSCTSKNLRAISTQGHIYQLYMVKLNSSIPNQQKIKTTSNFLSDSSQDQESTQPDDELKVQFLQEIDQYRNYQFDDILQKWKAITDFIKQKQKLCIDQIQYLRNICESKSNDLRKIHSEHKIQIQNSQPKLQNTQMETSITERLRQIQQNRNENENEKKKEICIQHQYNYMQDKQNCTESSQQIFTDFNYIEINHQIKVLSPQKKSVLRQRDLNLDLSFTKLKSNQTAQKLSKRSLFQDFQLDENFIAKSQILRTIHSFKSLKSNSNSTLTILNKLQENQRKEKLLKLKQSKLRIIKYLQQNYQSSSLTRLMFNLVLQAFVNTNRISKSLQLVAYNLSHTDIRCYLQAFEWQDIEVIKLVKTKLTDENFKILIDFIHSKQLKIKVLVLTSNKISQKSIEYFYQHQIGSIQQIYLGKNKIMKAKIRSKINFLNSKYSLYL